MSRESSIQFKVLGDSGPFSRAGKSIGYQLISGSHTFLIDCGSPLFNQIGGHGIENATGMVITHCHDDHKRWYTDLALYLLYAAQADKKLFLLSSEDIIDELRTASAAATDRSLSHDSRKIVDIPFELHTETQIIGPRAHYKIARKLEGNCKAYKVIDMDGKEMPADKAKVIISPSTGRPRLLMKDPDYKEWVEPESFYSFNSKFFYDSDKNNYTKNGITMEALKSPVWHGIPCIGLRFTTPTQSMVLTSDTVHNTEMWKQLSQDVHKQRIADPDEFNKASLISGDINDYIQRTWSEQRYGDAMNAFEDSVVLQDVALENSVVHTDYPLLDSTRLKRKNTLLTHSPDEMTSQWALAYSGKSYAISDMTIKEEVAGSLYALDADIYHKADGKFMVGYKRDEGAFTVYKNNGLLGLVPSSSPVPKGAEILFKVDLFEDMEGQYFPILENNDEQYMLHKDGSVNLLKFAETGIITGTKAKNLRGTL